MLSQENEHFIQCFLLLFVAGTKLLRKIMQKSLLKEAKTIDAVLTAPGTEDRIRKSCLITPRMKEKLYPPNKVTRDVSEWDISLLSFIILEFLKKHLNTPEKLSIEKIREHRNDFCHKAEPVIDGKTFTDTWTDLILIFNTVSHGWSQDEREKFNDTIRQISKVELSNALGDIKSSVLGFDGDNESIHQNIKKLEILQPSKVVLQLDSKVEVIDKNVSDLSRRMSDLERKKYAIEILLQIQADEKQTKDNAEKHLYQASKDRLDEEPSNEYLMPVRENVDKLASDIEQEGNVITDVIKGSVVYKITCKSSEDMIKLHDYNSGPLMQKRLKNIAESLQTLVGENIHLDSQIKTADSIHEPAQSQEPYEDVNMDWAPERSRHPASRTQNIENAQGSSQLGQAKITAQFLIETILEIEEGSNETPGTLFSPGAASSTVGATGTTEGATNSTLKESLKQSADPEKKHKDGKPEDKKGTFTKEKKDKEIIITKANSDVSKDKAPFDPSSQQDLKVIKAENEQLKEQTLCKICLDQTVSIVFLPCGHPVTCADCSPTKRKCPIGRALVKGTVRTYMS